MTSYSIKDANGVTQSVTVTVPGTAGTPSTDVVTIQGASGTTPVRARITDGTNDISVSTAHGDAVNNTMNYLPIGGNNYWFNGTTWDRAKGGLTGVNTSATGIQNSFGQMMYNTAAPAPANGNNVPLQSDASGNLKINLATSIPTGSNTIGNIGLNTGTNSIGTVGLNAGINYIGKARITDGTNDISVSTAHGDAVNNTMNYLPIGGNNYWFNGTSWDRAKGGLTNVNTSGTGIQNAFAQGVYNTTAPTLLNGNNAPLQLDSSGNLKVNTGIYNNVPNQVSFSASTTSAVALVANSNRTSLIIQNQDATNAIYVRFGAAAVANSTSFWIPPNTSVLCVARWEGNTTPSSSVNIIAAAGTPSVQIIEGN